MGPKGLAGMGETGRRTPRVPVRAPGLGDSQRQLLDALKRRGAASIPVLAVEVALNVETVRHHLQGLVGLGLVERQGTRRSGPGRPEVVYALTAEAERLFPRREGEVLQALAAYMMETGNEEALRSFFDAYIDERRDAALARVAHLEGHARVEEVARILSELGFMALAEQVETVGEGAGDGNDRANLRLCHCPLRELVEVTTIPCRAEIGFIRELLGERLTRLSYIPSGDTSCTYRPDAA